MFPVCIFAHKSFKMYLKTYIFENKNKKSDSKMVLLNTSC